MEGHLLFSLLSLVMLYSVLTLASSDPLISLLFVTPLSSFIVPHSNFHVGIYFLFLLLGLTTSQLKFKENLASGIYGLAVIILISLSFVSNYTNDTLILFGKPLKLIAIFSPLILTIRVNPVKIDTVCKIYLYFILFMTILTYPFFMKNYDLGLAGIPRASGMASDANYWALLALFLLMVYRYSSTRINRFLIFATLAVIIASQSLTIISLYLIVEASLFLKKTKLSFSFKKINQKVIPVLFILLLLSGNIVLIYAMNYKGTSPSLIAESDLNDFVKKKSISLLQRFEAQSKSMDLVLSSNFNFLFGVGSSRSLELLPRVLHNVFLQILFDHGFIFLFIFLVLLLSMLNLLYKMSSSLFYIVTITCFLFDPIFSFFLTFIYICICNLRVVERVK